MTDPQELIDAVVTAARYCSDLVQDELGGDATKISSYQEVAPDRIINTIFGMQRPALMFTYDGLIPGDRAHMRNMEQEKHRIVGYFAAPEGEPFGAQRMFRKLIDGAMPDGTLFRYYEIHPNCYFMELPKFERVVHPDQADFWKLTFLLTENGG